MTPDELLAELRARFDGLHALMAGRGDPLDLPVVLLHDVPRDVAVAVARGMSRHPGVAAAADVSGAPEAARPQRLAVVAALAFLLRHQHPGHPWHDLVDEVRYDALGRPGAWRDLSPYALTLAESLDATEETPHGSLLRVVARAALDAPSQELLSAAQRGVERARRAARARRWQVWLGERRGTPELRDAVDRLEAGALPMAAAAGVPEALARVRLGEALDGEVSLAVLPAGLVIEWDGDALPPETATSSGQELELLERASLASRAWLLGAPPRGLLDLTLRRGDQRADVRWTG